MTKGDDLRRHSTLNSLNSQAQKPILRAAECPMATLQDRSPRPETLIEKATALADQGRLVDAAKCCEEHLRKFGSSADVFYLMGLIRAATANLGDAEELYRKALYLDPNHYQSLVHLALLLEKRGDRGAAKVLHNRVRRLERQAGGQHG